MSKYITIFICIFCFACSNKSIPFNSKPFSNQQHLLGKQKIYALQAEPFNSWFTKQYNNYMIDSTTIQQLKPLFSNVSIEIFLGTWCGDSKREVPIMIKVLEAVSFDTNNIKLVCVDNDLSAYKQSPTHEEKDKNIHHVPTLIAYSNQKEIGRIVEKPHQTIEKDLLQLMLKNYTPRYKGIIFLEQHSLLNKKLNTKQLNEIASRLKPLLLHSGELNAYGYMLLSQKKYIEAINIFSINQLVYPNNLNVEDSLAEAFYYSGNKNNAKKQYLKILQLDSSNIQAKKMLPLLQ